MLVGAAVGGGVSTALPRSQRELLCLDSEGLGKGKNLLWAGEYPRGLGDLSRAFSVATPLRVRSRARRDGNHTRAWLSAPVFAEDGFVGVFGVVSGFLTSGTSEQRGGRKK